MFLPQNGSKPTRQKIIIGRKQGKKQLSFCYIVFNINMRGLDLDKGMVHLVYLTPFPFSVMMRCMFIVYMPVLHTFLYNHTYTLIVVMMHHHRGEQHA